MSPLIPLGVGIGTLLFMLRPKTHAAASPSVTTTPPTTTPKIPRVTTTEVEGRHYVVTHYGSGQYKVELMSAQGPVAAISFGQSGAPVRSGNEELIDKYILQDIHKFPRDIFGS